MALTKLDSNVTTFTQAGDNASARTVDTKLKEIVHFKDFGAVGNGTTNDVTAVENAFNAASGKVLDGGGLTYKCNSMFATDSQNITVQNATFDFSGVEITGSTGYIQFLGSTLSGTDISADVNVGDNTFTVASTTGLTTKDSWHILEDDQVIYAGESLTLGQYVFVKEVDESSKLVTLHNDVLYKFLEASNAQLVPVTMKTNITFRDVIIKGANPAGVTTDNNHCGIKFQKCQNVTIDNCTFEDIHRICVIFDACVNVKVSNSTCKHATKTGTEYGFGVHNGCYGVNITNCYAQDLRHFVTIGDNEGINLFVNVTNNHISGCRDAGIDSHAGGDFVNFSGNTIEGSSFDSGQLDGIVFQGFNAIINDNIIVGMRRQAIFAQQNNNLAAASGGTGSCVICGNQIINHGGASTSEAGIYVVNDENALGTIKGVTIANNIVEGNGNIGIYVYSLGGAISNVAITGNTIGHHDVYGIALRSGSDANETISMATITGNVLNSIGTASGADGIYLLGNSTSKVINSTITGNVIDMVSGSSGASGVHLDYTDYCSVSGNTIRNASTASAAVNTSTAGNTYTLVSNNIEDTAISGTDKVIYNQGDELTISSGEITVVNSHHKIDTESDASTDDLVTINGGVGGQMLLIQPANASRTIVAKDSTGNLRLNGDFTMNSSTDSLLLMNVTASYWMEISRSDNGT